jgi:hypothetical protein
MRSASRQRQTAVALQNLALEQGYESQLVRFKRPRSYAVTSEFASIVHNDPCKSQDCQSPSGQMLGDGLVVQIRDVSRDHLEPFFVLPARPVVLDSATGVVA